MFIQSIEFGFENGITEVVDFTVYGEDDDASDMLYGLIIDYWQSNEWQIKGIVLPTKEDIVNLIMNDDDLDDKDYYLSNIDTMLKEFSMIVSAAVKLILDDYAGSEVCIPVHRHKDRIIIGEQLLGYKPFLDEEGFLTDKGEFLDRWEAADHAYECGQLIETAEEPRIDRLMSEDLW